MSVTHSLAKSFSGLMCAISNPSSAIMNPLSGLLIILNKLPPVPATPLNTRSSSILAPNKLRQHTFRDILQFLLPLKVFQNEYHVVSLFYFRTLISIFLAAERYLYVVITQILSYSIQSRREIPRA